MEAEAERRAEVGPAAKARDLSVVMNRPGAILIQQIVFAALVRPEEQRALPQEREPHLWVAVVEMAAMGAEVGAKVTTTVLA